MSETLGMASLSGAHRSIYGVCHIFTGVGVWLCMGCESINARSRLLADSDQKLLIGRSCAINWE